MDAGDVWSTIGDLVAWIDALRAGQLLDGRYRTLMLTERAPTGGRPTARGYGWFVGTIAGETLVPPRRRERGIHRVRRLPARVGPSDRDAQQHRGDQPRRTR
ncbi:hypothetical protein [Micromonospora sp. DT47]|uniref:hypothetical protein n=1 Tax=Micromonospora sp. DT47 TaxID=3393431 RepID=UPI003CF15C3B